MALVASEIRSWMAGVSIGEGARVFSSREKWIAPRSTRSLQTSSATWKSGSRFAGDSGSMVVGILSSRVCIILVLRSMV